MTSLPLLLSIGVFELGLVLGLVLLLGLVVLWLSRSEPLARRVESWFQRPPQPSKPVRRDHYYRPYWQG